MGRKRSKNRIRVKQYIAMQTQQRQSSPKPIVDTIDEPSNTPWWFNPWWVALVMVAIGFVVYSSGLHSPFIEDDQNQVVNNIPVHSISNIKLFFNGSTFFNGQQNTLSGGLLYRPLMTVVFSFIYTLF